MTIPKDLYEKAKKDFPEWWRQAKFINSEQEAEGYVHERIRKQYALSPFPKVPDRDKRSAVK